MIDGLKLCPFCDGTAKIYHIKPSGMNEFYYVVTCSNCDVESALCETDYEAIERWNKRVIPTAEVLPVEASQLKELQQIRQSVEYKTERILLDIGEQVYKLMQKYNISKEQLAGILGINQTRGGKR